MAEAIRVNLVEAHAGLRSDLARALAGSGFRVSARSCAAPDGSGLSRSNTVDVLDLAAPGVAEAIGAATDLSRSVLLVCESAFGAGGLPTRGMECEILAKPFDYASLESRILGISGSAAARGGRRRDPLLETADPELARRFERARRLARKPVSICLEGELGSGRRALAAAIHDWSERAAQDFEVLERAVLEGPDVEQTLRACLARAGEGTVVLVDPDALPDASQSALVAMLRRVDRSGGPRWLSLSTGPLEQAVAEGRLAPELHYRLEDARLSLPALRDRPRDQLAICRAMVQRLARELGGQAPEVDEAVVAVFARDGFRGNRLGVESRLRNALMRWAEGQGELAVILEGEAGVGARVGSRPAMASVHLKTLERDAIVRALGQHAGNRTRASLDLGINVRTLRNKIREYGLR